MKLIIGDWEVNVSAKKKDFDKKASLMETIYFLNECSIAFSEAAKNMAATMPASSKRYEDLGYDIYAALKAAGAYKEV